MVEKSCKAKLPSMVITSLSQLAFPGRAETIAALVELLKAHEYAFDAKHDIWDFAVEIATLRQFGLTDTDLRWLVSKNYVEHRCDATEPGDVGRRFHPTNPLKFQPQSCFVLTTSGVALASRLHYGNDAGSSLLPVVFEQTPMRESPKPCWDAARRQLRVSEYIVKLFRWPAPNQEIVLTAFEEEGWTRRVDDPLIPADGQEPKQRLHDTIKCLNRRQKVRLIQFCGDGTGQGVAWNYTRKARDLLSIEFPDQNASQTCG